MGSMVRAWMCGLAAALLTLAAGAGHAAAQERATPLLIRTDQQGPVISADIFGQFAEHLGTGIYGGVWVGPNSSIPNVRGIRSDVVEALRELHVPFVRWPGGCFAEEYHWRNGIGPANRRTSTVNVSWGNVLEPNTFGTHEYMDFIEQIGAEAYVNANIATGSPQEAAEWLEYMTSAVPTTLAQLRAANGHREPWRIKYFGLGNESWTCGGAMSAEAYITEMKIYAMFSRNLHPDQNAGNRFIRSPNAMQRIAVGPMDNDNTAWTEAVMQAWRDRDQYRWGIEGIQFHRYTAGIQGVMRDRATGFTEQDYAAFVRNTYEMDHLISVHSAVMDRYDPERQVALSVDEFGVWLAPTEGTNILFLQQQNSLRDAILASINLNIFTRHAGRVRVAAIAQMVNVLQSMLLTDGPRMVRTPTFYIYRMYVPFQNAHSIAIEFDRGVYQSGDISLPQVDAIAARGADGNIWLAITNIDPTREARIETQIAGVSSATGETLSAAALDSINTFDAPDTVRPQPYRAEAQDGRLTLTLPPHSVTVVRLDP